VPDPVEPLDEAVVEDIVRWYVGNGGTSGSDRMLPIFGMSDAAFTALGPRERIGLILGECPYRVDAGNPYQPEATITAVERWVIVGEAYKSSCRQAAILQTLDGSMPSPMTTEVMGDRDVYQRLEKRYRADPTWQAAMDWLRQAFARVVHGDPHRGLSGDASFLCHIQGT
jgi:hypothetical protein